ncbi:MAG: hypothetical protein ACRDCW_15780, partial [Sarcina sp.]
TFLILSILSFIKKIKEGVLASSIGGGVCISIFIIHYIYHIINTFFANTGITLKDIFMYIIYIALTCLAFIIIILLIKFLGIKRR